MSGRFHPRLSILPGPQRVLWDELAGVPPTFTLYGGTAVALHLGHRSSIDFDFFGTQDFDPDQLYRNGPFLRGAKVIQQQRNTLTCLVERGGPVKISFFGLPNLRRIDPVLTADDTGLPVASLLDLAGTKAAVVQQRAEAKDYVDLGALMNAGIGLPLALSAACAIYGAAFNPQLTLKALSYFGDGDLSDLPDAVKERLIRAVVEIDLDHLPALSTVGNQELRP
jgi:hypothetical protein